MLAGKLNRAGYVSGTTGDSTGRIREQELPAVTVSA